MNAICEKVTDFLKGWDGITEAQCNNFKIKGDVKSKSVIGGICSLISTGFLIRIMVENGYYMITREYPDLFSIEKPFDGNNYARKNWRSMSKLMMEI